MKHTLRNLDCNTQGGQCRRCLVQIILVDQCTLPEGTNESLVMAKVRQLDCGGVPPNMKGVTRRRPPPK